MTWTYPRTGSTSDLDPGYLKEVQFSNSAFHLGLNKWIYNNKNKPMLHIDMHGKGLRNRTGTVEPN